MADSDPAASALEEIKERNEQHIAALKLTEWSVANSPYGDLRKAVAALEAVLKAHRPSTSDGRCCWCRDADGQRSAWPCGEYLTITAALAGKEAGDGE